MRYLAGSPYIAGLLGWCDEPVSIVLKFCALGSLDAVIKNGKVQTTGFAREVEFMHTK